VREIWFRGKRVSDGEWIQGDLITETSSKLEVKRTFIHLRLSEVAFTENFLSSSLVLYEVDPETVGQFTCLHDENEREIYEGDITQDNTANYCKLIAWHGNGFKWKSILNKRGIERQKLSIRPFPSYDFCEMQNVESHEVIGNVWDNPELVGDDLAEPS